MFGNKYSTNRNLPVFISSFSKCNIKTVRDLLGMDTNTFLQQEFIRNRLHDQNGWIAKCNKIKTSFSSNILEILKGPINQHEQQQVTVNMTLLFS